MPIRRAVEMRANTSALSSFFTRPVPDPLRPSSPAATTRQREICGLAQQITDERTRLAALDLAAQHERQAAEADAQRVPSLSATGTKAAAV